MEHLTVRKDWFNQTTNGVPFWKPHMRDFEKLTSKRIAYCRPNLITVDKPTKSLNEHPGLIFVHDKVAEFVPNQNATLKRAGGLFPIRAFPLCAIKSVFNPFAREPAGTPPPLWFMGRPSTLSTGARTVAKSMGQKETWSPNSKKSGWPDWGGLATQASPFKGIPMRGLAG